MYSGNDLTVTWRFLRRHSGSAAVIVLTLTLGLAANSAAFAVLKAFLLSSLGVPDAERLHVISQIQNGGRFFNAWANYTALREQVKSFESVCAIMPADFNWGDGDEARRVAAARATASFFATVGVRPLLGREFTEAEQGPNPAAVVLISHRIWQAHFDRAPDILTRSMRLNGEPHAIIGVLPEGLSLPPDVDVWVPIDLPKELWTRITGGGRQLLVLGRLADGVENAVAQQELRAFSERLAAESIANKDWTFTSLPAREFYLNGADRMILLVQIGAIVLLIMTATNLSSLLLAWVAERQRETAVRLALGARRAHLFRQQLTLSLALTLTGGAAGLILAHVALPALRELNPTPLLGFFLVHLRIDPVVATGTLLLAVAIGILVAFVPLWQAGRTDLIAALKLESRGGTASAGALRWQKCMVVLQSAVTVVVLTAAFFAVAGFRQATRAGPGYQTDGRGVFRVQLPETAFPDQAKRAAFMRSFDENLSREAELVASGVTVTLPFGDTPRGFGLRAELPSGDFVEEPEILGYRRVTPGYLAAMGIPLLEGRMLESSDDSRSPFVAVISKALADKYWPGSSPVGKRFRRPGAGPTLPDIMIVGVVGTVKDSGTVPAARKGECLYVPYVQDPWPKFSVVVQGRAGVDAAIAAGIRALKATAPGVAAYDVTTLKRLAWQSNASLRLQMTFLALFAAVAAGVAILGSYGVMSQLVNYRAREMAVRLAIGDSPGGVLWRILRQNAALASLGSLVGVSAAWFGATRLEGIIAGVEGQAPGPFLATFAVTIMLTQAASLLPAWRAAGTDVQKTLAAG